MGAAIRRGAIRRNAIWQHQLACRFYLVVTFPKMTKAILCQRPAQRKACLIYGGITLFINLPGSGGQVACNLGPVPDGNIIDDADGVTIRHAVHQQQAGTRLACKRVGVDPALQRCVCVILPGLKASGRHQPQTPRRVRSFRKPKLINIP